MTSETKWILLLAFTVLWMTPLLWKGCDQIERDHLREHEQDMACIRKSGVRCIEANRRWIVEKDKTP
jgi:hypothetical protein